MVVVQKKEVKAKMVEYNPFVQIRIYFCGMITDIYS